MFISFVNLNAKEPVLPIGFHIALVSSPNCHYHSCTTHTIQYMQFTIVNLSIGTDGSDDDELRFNDTSTHEGYLHQIDGSEQKKCRPRSECGVATHQTNFSCIYR